MDYASVFPEEENSYGVRICAVSTKFFREIAAQTLCKGRENRFYQLFRQNQAVYNIHFFGDITQITGDFFCGYATGYAPENRSKNALAEKLTIERPKFSTLSTAFSTESRLPGKMEGICISVYINYFDPIRPAFHFLYVQHVDNSVDFGPKIGS